MGNVATRLFSKIKIFIRHFTPFIMLAYSLVSAIWLYFNKDTYYVAYDYLSQSIGFSLFTNLFMYTVYMNKKYCTATKITVVCLFLLNVIDIISTYYGKPSYVYEIYLIIFTLAILTLKKYA
jgi:hypothetical protein